MAQNKKTVAELKNELYIATLIEEHMKDDRWLTTYSKEKYESYATLIEIGSKATGVNSTADRTRYKKHDMLLYIMLEHFISPDCLILNDEEKSIARTLICGRCDLDWNQISLNTISSIYEETINDKIGFNEQLDRVISKLCHEGENCLEPCSKHLKYSEQMVTSSEDRIVRICRAAISNNENFDKSRYVIVPRDSAVTMTVWQNVSKKYDSILLDFCWFDNFSCDMFNLSKALDCLDDHGYLIIIWNREWEKTLGADWTTENMGKLRKSPLLDAFIQDTGLLDIEAYILRKGKNNDKIHVLKNISNDNYCEYVDIDMLQWYQLSRVDLEALDFDLDKSSLITTFHAMEGEKFLSLGDFLVASRDEFVRLDHISFGKIFSPDNYATSFDTFAVHPSSLREAQVDDKWKKVSQPVFVMRCNPFAVAYVEASEEQPVFFRENTMTFIVKTDVVDLKYLYLLSMNGKLEQLVWDCQSDLFDFEKYTVCPDEKDFGYWQAKSLLSYQGLIAIPSLSKQKELCDSFVKLERSRLDRAAMSQYRQDIHERKHALGQIMTQMRSNWESLLLAKNEHDGILVDEFVYGKKHPHTIKQIFETLDSYMKELDEGIESFTPEDNTIFQTKEKIFLQDYLQEYVKTHSNPCFELQIDNSDERRDHGAIVFSKKALETILQNLIFNAWKHGFKGRSSGNIIRFSISEDDDSIQLLVSNNGTPLDKNMDNGVLFKFGKSSSRGQESIDGHHHIGLGCHQVWCLMRDKGQGDVQCISEPDKEFPVTFKLVFNK